MNFSTPNKIFSLLAILFLICSCKSGPFNVFQPTSPHDAYKKSLTSSGLDKTAMGKTWIEMSDEILERPVSIQIPYLEKGYLPPDKVQAAAFSFKMERGQKLNIKLHKKPLQGFMIYTDVWVLEDDGGLKIVASADTLGKPFQTDINRTSIYVLRLQPELLAGGEYTLEITSGPSLDYPLKSYQKNQIRSFWGDGRDANSRKHEGVDIFSAFRTPVVAIAVGTTRVNENNLGGKVVWLRPEGKDFTLYYAHLDEQIVTDGQTVQVGDTLGRMGNTGNARSTPPHLHFGIYTSDGAVNPLPFINPVIKNVPEIISQTKFLNSTLRTAGNAALTGGQSASQLKNGTILRVISASENNYRVELPDGTTGFVSAGKVGAISGNLRNIKLDASQTNLFDRPDSSAAVKLSLQSGKIVSLIGSFGDFDFVSTGNDRGWIRR